MEEMEEERSEISMRQLVYLLFFIFFPLHVLAAAEIEITEKSLQKGYFQYEDCEQEEYHPEPHAINPDMCTCKADIMVPHIGGSSDIEILNTINAVFDNIGSHSECPPGKPLDIYQNKEKRTPTEKRVSFKVTLLTEELLSVLFTKFSYGGGAHGADGLEGVTFNLKTGENYKLSDIIVREKEAMANQMIYHALKAMPESIFDKEVEERKNSFIKEGHCKGCTYVLSKNGINIIFQEYTVGPFSSGPIKVELGRYIIQDDFIRNQLN